MYEASLLRAYAKNVKHMYFCVPGNIIDCIWFIWGIYTDVVSYMHMN